MSQFTAKNSQEARIQRYNKHYHMTPEHHTVMFKNKYHKKDIKLPQSVLSLIFLYMNVKEI